MHAGTINSTGHAENIETLRTLHETCTVDRITAKKPGVILRNMALLGLARGPEGKTTAESAKKPYKTTNIIKCLE